MAVPMKLNEQAGDGGSARSPPPPPPLRLPALVKATAKEEKLYNLPYRANFDFSLRDERASYPEQGWSVWGNTHSRVQVVNGSWSWRTDKRGKPEGWMSTEVGSCTQFKPSVKHPRVFMLSLLKSYDHMGSYAVEVIAGKERGKSGGAESVLAAKRFDSLWPQHASIATLETWDLAGVLPVLSTTDKAGAEDPYFRVCVVASDPPRKDNKVKLFSATVV